VLDVESPGAASMSVVRGTGRTLRFESRQTLVVYVILLVGTLIRLSIYAGRPSLWIDEARLALNIGTRSYLQLLRPLDYDQAAPPLFLWATKLMVQVGGMNEYALRVIPLLAGVCVPVLVLVVGSRLANRRVGSLAGVLAAVLPGLVRHSVEAKP
jgi:predicted membrane-bound mannosyltransferase